MTEIPFEVRLAAAGLRTNPEDILKLEVLVKDMDRAAALVREPRCYADEPLSAFRLMPVARRARATDPPT